MSFQNILDTSGTLGILFIVGVLLMVAKIYDTSASIVGAMRFIASTVQWLRIRWASRRDVEQPQQQVSRPSRQRLAGGVEPPAISVTVHPDPTRLTPYITDGTYELEYDVCIPTTQ